MEIQNGLSYHYKSPQCLPYVRFVLVKPLRKKIKIILIEVHDRIDDIQDGSALRRGFPSTHTVFGIPFAINAGNYAYFTALDDILKLDNVKVSLAKKDKM